MPGTENYFGAGSRAGSEAGAGSRTGSEAGASLTYGIRGSSRGTCGKIEYGEAESGSGNGCQRDPKSIPEPTAQKAESFNNRHFRMEAFSSGPKIRIARFSTAEKIINGLFCL